MRRCVCVCRVPVRSVFVVWALRSRARNARETHPVGRNENIVGVAVRAFQKRLTPAGKPALLGDPLCDPVGPRVLLVPLQ